MSMHSLQMCLVYSIVIMYCVTDHSKGKMLISLQLQCVHVYV